MSKKHENTEHQMFCGYCGERLPELGEGQTGSCPSCKKKFGRRRIVRRPPPPPADYEEVLFQKSMQYWKDPAFKDPVLAALLSAVIPGAGQLYNAQLFKGALIFLTCWLVIPYFLGIFDAYVTAESTNRWQAVEVRKR